MKFAKRRLIHWIAILAVLMSALAPTISQAIALNESGKGFVMQICSASGAKITQVIGDNSSVPADQSATTDSHCPYCVVQGAYVLPSVATFNFAVPQTVSLYPSLFYQSPKPLFVWGSSPARAPPALS